ncbi:MAG: class I SAM-dependent methyltransferase [Patescibacteria group bacterium]
MSNISQILITAASSDYELLDSGDGEKLERFGKIVLSRPDPQALWEKKLSTSEWKKSDGNFTRGEKEGSWSLKKNVLAKWQISFGDLKFWIKPTAFKHTGLFPEQLPNWEWLRKLISSVALVGATDSPDLSEAKRRENSSRRESAQHGDIEVLNLFGYTGGATLACAQAGAKVVHIDSSKSAVAWARENAEISGLKDAPIRWIVEDARVFVEREIKRERKYDGIIMDPPAFGHGPTNELWKVEEHFLSLMEDCKKLLKNKPSFFLVNGYSAGYSAIAYANNLLELKNKYGGEIEMGELVIQESGTKGQESQDKETNKEGTQARLLPAGIFARWSTK